MMYCKYTKYLILADVAQLDRAPDYGSDGSGFESWRPHQIERKGCIATV